MDDIPHMRAALALARRGLGTTWPNPSVGCVIVRHGRVVGRGHTASGGRPHAEAQALAMAGEAARGAVAYVTLEPCNHTGHTPPCTDALIAAGVSRVVIAGNDPDPRVNGSGIARLRQSGVEVVTGVLSDEADEMQAGFLSQVRSGRPSVTLKLASTLDGRIATKDGKSKWITGEAARRAGHALRGQNDAVLVGVGTVMVDDPDLTCRIAGYSPSNSVRIVVDSHLRTRFTAKVVATARQFPTWIVHREGADPDRKGALADAGIRLIEVASSVVGVDLSAALQALGSAGLTRVLVEGGAQIAAAMLRADVVDALAWFHAPAVMGGDGWPAAQAFGVDTLAAMPRFRCEATRSIGPDMLTTFRRAA